MAVVSGKRRRGNVWLGPDSEKGEPSRGGSKVTGGSSCGLEVDATAVAGSDLGMSEAVAMVEAAGVFVKIPSKAWPSTDTAAPF